MFDEHVERSVGEIICGASLLQLGEECKTCRVATPVTCSEFMGRICLHQSELKEPRCQEWSNTANQMILSAVSKLDTSSY